MEEKILTPQEEVNALVEKGLKALNEYASFTQEKIDYIVKKASVAALDQHGQLAAAAVAAPAAGAAAPAAEEKTEFTIVLKEVGPNKIPVIKVVREATGLGLSEAKALVDGAPSTIKENVPTEAAKELEAKFKEVGATIELK